MFEKENTLTARQQLHITGLTAEECKVEELPGYLFIPGNSNHPTFVKVDLSADKPVAKLSNAEHFAANQAVLVLFTVQSYCIGGNAGFKATLSELVHLSPLADIEASSAAKIYTPSPRKMFRGSN